jgi:hypothetical protein
LAIGALSSEAAPVRVKKTRQNKNRALVLIVRTENALVKPATKNAR